MQSVFKRSISLIFCGVLLAQTLVLPSYAFLKKHPAEAEKPAITATAPANTALGFMEETLIGAASPSKPMEERLARLETILFGSPQTGEPMFRQQKLMAVMSGQKEPPPVQAPVQPVPAAPAAASTAPTAPVTGYNNSTGFQNAVPSTAPVSPPVQPPNVKQKRSRDPFDDDFFKDDGFSDSDFSNSGMASAQAPRGPGIFSMLGNTAMALGSMALMYLGNKNAPAYAQSPMAMNPYYGYNNGGYIPGYPGYYGQMPYGQMQYSQMPYGQMPYNNVYGNLAPMGRGLPYSGIPTITNMYGY